jgi:Uma2 family endonuclease
MHGLGGIYGPDTSFKIGRNERMPDVSFVAAARIPPEGEPDGAWPIPPDLAVEVISPNDIFEKVNAKVREYFEAGVRQVWLISIEQRTVMVYSSPTAVAILEEREEIDGGEIIPGFRCRVSDLFTLPGKASDSVNLS